MDKADRLFLKGSGLLVFGAMLFIFSVAQMVRVYERWECEQFGKETGRQVKFYEPSWLSWECMCLGADGKWIPTKQIRGE